MSAIQGTYINGHIVLDQETTWPDGLRVSVEPVGDDATIGLRDEDWPDTPEGITAHLALMDQMKPLELTSDEEAVIESARQAQKEFQKATLSKHFDELESIWE